MNGEEKPRTIPLEDVASLIITSFSASLHSHLLIEADLGPEFGADVAVAPVIGCVAIAREVLALTQDIEPEHASDDHRTLLTDPEAGARRGLSRTGRSGIGSGQAAKGNQGRSKKAHTHGAGTVDGGFPGQGADLPESPGRALLRHPSPHPSWPL